MGDALETSMPSSSPLPHYPEHHPASPHLPPQPLHIMPEEKSDRSTPLEVDKVTGNEASEGEEEGISILKKIISDGEKSITLYESMAATESEGPAGVIQKLIKVKASNITDAQWKIAALQKAPKVKCYSPFTTERCTYALTVIEAACQMVHDFAVEENVDPTMVQCLFQAKLVTNVKNSSGDAWQILLAIGRQSHGAHAGFFAIEIKVNDILYSGVNLNGILPPEHAEEALSSPKHEDTIAQDSWFYKLGLENAGEQGKDTLKELIIQWSREATAYTLKTGVQGDAWAKAMANIHQELNAFMGIEYKV